MKPNITMIGMPSSGKSTIGVLLAKRLGFSFVDVDIVIQEKEGRLLKEIIADEGMDGFLEVENRINAGLDVRLSVIAPGGSVIYGEEAMKHLKEISEVVYLKMSYEEMERRIGNVVDRGVALKPGFTLRDLYNERVPLYEKYADIVIDEAGKTPGDTVDELRRVIEGMMDQDKLQAALEKLFYSTYIQAADAGPFRRGLRQSAACFCATAFPYIGSADAARQSLLQQAGLRLPEKS